MNGVLVVIAVRLKSSRLPGKALEDLAGRPLIVRLHERVSQATLPAGVVWCTSGHAGDNPLEDLGRDINASVYRGDELDVMSRFIEVAWARNAHTVVRVTGDNPLTDPVMMDVMLRAHQAENAEYSFTEDLPRGTRCEVISVDALERCHDLVQDPAASEYMTLMLRRPDHFRVLKVDAPVPEQVRPELRLTVDTPEDLSVVRAVYEAFTGHPPPLAEIIAWLDDHPEIRDMNSQVVATAIDASINVGLQGD